MTSASAPRRLSLWAALLLAAFFLQGFFLIRATSPTTDEVAFHMVNGYVYLTTRDYRMSPANPPLIREWMALPWTLIHPSVDLRKKSWEEADSVPFAREFFYRDNRAIANRLLGTARFMILLFGLGIGWGIYAWSRALYGEVGGLVSLALYAFCPTFLGHSSIATTDIGMTFFTFMAGFELWKYLESARRRNAWAAALFFGLASAAKFNALFLSPVFLFVIWLRKGNRALFKALLAGGAVTFIVIWASVFFQTAPILQEGVPRVAEKEAYVAAAAEKIFGADSAMKERLIHAAKTLPVPAPSYWLGVAGILRSHQSSYLHYSFGRWTTESHPLHYIVSFLIKMTLPFLALLALRFYYFRRASTDGGTENLLLLAPNVFLFTLTAFDSTGVGVRYLFPSIVFLFVWIGGVARVRSGKVLAALCALNALTAFTAFPNHIAYFNEAVGGVRGGYKIVRGSDVDWGQGLVALRRYQDKNSLPELRLDYFGTADPTYYGIRSRALTEGERRSPEPAVYAVSIFNLESVPWAAARRPDAVVGGSIFIFDARTKT